MKCNLNIARLKLCRLSDCVHKFSSNQLRFFLDRSSSLWSFLSFIHSLIQRCNLFHFCMKHGSELFFFKFVCFSFIHLFRGVTQNTVPKYEGKREIKKNIDLRSKRMPFWTLLMFSSWKVEQNIYCKTLVAVVLVTSVAVALLPTHYICILLGNRILWNAT